jgi:mannosylglycoprotein endo-beta-mannosidase
VLKQLRDSLLPKLDGTRFFFEYSNDDSMSLHSGDGPYTIQTDRYFWEHRSFPFNSEIGSVGVGDRESIERFIPKEHLVVPRYDQKKKKWIVDSVWQYHKYSSYDSSIEIYGHPTDIKDFGMKAQLVNYNQYRALIESFSAHMWDWYTGVIIWKTQNPWTAMVGQMYDVYLDPNACLFGLQQGGRLLHATYDPVKKNVVVVNNGYKKADGLKVVTSIVDFKGKQTVVNESDVNIGSNKSVIAWKASSSVDSQFKREGGFLHLSVTDKVTGREIDDNLYWMPDAAGNYSGLKKKPEANVKVKAKKKGAGKIEVTISNPVKGPIAFFIRASLIDSNTYERILPAFCNNNYISVLPGKTKVVQIDFTPVKGKAPIIDVEGWNVEEQFIEPEE